MNVYKVKDLGEFLREMVLGCLKKGMQLPVIIAAVASSGSVRAVRYEWNESHDGIDCVDLASHHEGKPKKFDLPMNIMIVDSEGRANYAVIREEGIEYLH